MDVRPFSGMVSQDQWTDNSDLRSTLNFQWIDFGTQVLVWVSDGQAFNGLDAAVPGVVEAPATTLFRQSDAGETERGKVLAARLSAHQYVRLTWHRSSWCVTASSSAGSECVSCARRTSRVRCCAA